MAKTLKKSLVERAEENARVTKGTSKNQQVVKEGIPNDHHPKQQNTETPIVGVNLGITKNMDNYESLRVDVWLTDTVMSGESVEQTYERVIGVVDNVLQNTVNSYIE